jgi:uncharacterized DUF497 family protein
VFEYDDPEKSRSNKEKHGIDFEEAQLLWMDGGLVEFRARVMDEVRFVLVGMIDDKHWTAVVTYRGKNTRIISVRRSRSKEVESYESRRI